MKYIEIFANILNFSGLIILLDSQPIKNLIATAQKKIDIYGRGLPDYSDGGKSDLELMWKYRIKPVLGLGLIFVGNFIILILSVLQVVHNG